MPLIDIGPFLDSTASHRARRDVADEVASTCRSTGFLVVAGHGVPSELITRMDDAFDAFFSLPEKQKLPAQGDGSGPGYRSLGSTALAKSRDEETPPDMNERFTVASVDFPEERRTAETEEWYPRNRWPPEPTGFRDVTEEYFRAMDALARTLMRIFAVGLDLDEHYFEPSIDAPISRLTGIHYPPMRAEPRAGQLRAGAHTDYGSITILHKRPGASGLQVQTGDGDWFDVDPVANTFIVNIGDMLAQWTNDAWVSTMHRVANPTEVGDAESARLSIAFFHQPNHDAVIAPLPTCVSADRPASYAPVTSGEHLRGKLGKSVRSVPAAP